MAMTPESFEREVRRIVKAWSLTEDEAAEIVGAVGDTPEMPPAGAVHPLEGRKGRHVTVRFRWADGASVVAIARFPTLPGASGVLWAGEVKRWLAVVPAPFNDRPTPIGYAGNFERALKALGKTSGAVVEITERGGVGGV